MKWPIKDTNEKLDYAINWSQRLVEGETIESSVFTVISGGVVIESQSENDILSTVWLSGGTAGQTAKVACQIVTSDNRIYKEVVQIPIVNLASG